MHCITEWKQSVRDLKSTDKVSVYDLCFDPAEGDVLVAAGNVLLKYDFETGRLLHRLSHHKSTIYSVHYSRDGSYFASGGIDQEVAIWNTENIVKAKYVYSSAIQVVRFNPKTAVLASCSENELSLHALDCENVRRVDYNGNILCSEWSGNGEMIAIGLRCGDLSIVSQDGTQIGTVACGATAWTLAWNSDAQMLVGCLDQTLKVVNIQRRQVVNAIRIGFNPCGVSWMSSSSFWVVSGANGEFTTHHIDGSRIDMFEKFNEWCWACKAHSSLPYVVTGFDSGLIVMRKIQPIIAFNREFCAFCDTVSIVKIYNIDNQKMTRIDERAAIKSIALFKEDIALHVGDEIRVYKTKAYLELENLTPHIRVKMSNELEYEKLVLSRGHYVQVKNNLVNVFSLNGNGNVKEIAFDDQVTAVRLIGGPPEAGECFLIGLINGAVFRIDTRIGIPKEIMTHNAGVRSFQLNSSGRLLAFIDNINQCHVYDLDKKHSIACVPNAVEIVWNLEIDDCICIKSKNGMLDVILDGLSVYNISVQGSLVGFRASKIYTLQSGDVVEEYRVNLRSAICQCIAKGDFEKAYEIACVGATSNDWETLTDICLQKLQLDIARKSFMKQSNLRGLKLVDKLVEIIVEDPDEVENVAPRSTQKIVGDVIGKGELNVTSYKAEVCRAHILAHNGRIQDAVYKLKEIGALKQAMSLALPLKRWDLVKICVNGIDPVEVRSVTESQCQWLEKIGDKGTIAKLYTHIGAYSDAIEILIKENEIDAIIDIATKLDKNEKQSLLKCGEYFMVHEKYSHAKEAFIKLDDVDRLLGLYVKTQEWEEASQLCKKKGKKYWKAFNIHHARWLAETSNLEECQRAYENAEEREEYLKTMKTLLEFAVHQKRYDDGAYICWLVSQSRLNKGNRDQNTRQHFHFCWRAYQAYKYIDEYIEKPFNCLDAQVVFNATQFLNNVVVGPGLGSELNISSSAILWAMATTGIKCSAHYSASYAMTKLQKMRVPEKWIPPMESVNIRIALLSESLRDKAALTCFRCLKKNLPSDLTKSSKPGMNHDSCIFCYHPFIRSMISFDNLPLVEFVPGEREVTIEKQDIFGPEKYPAFEKNQPEEQNEEKIHDKYIDGFLEFLLAHNLKEKKNANTHAEYKILQVPDTVLKNVPSNSVYYLKTSPALATKRTDKPRFIKNLFPEVQIRLCETCCSFFHEDDLEMACLSNGMVCPMCKTGLNL